VVDIILRAALGRIRDGIRSLTLGADKENPASLGDNVARNDDRLMQKRHRFRKIDDVDLVARPEEIVLHFRVPAMRLVAEMHASLKELTHSELRYHRIFLLPVRPPRAPMAMPSPECQKGPQPPPWT